MDEQKGFTLIELMVVVAIVGTLLAISLPVYTKYQDRAKVVAAFAEISALKTAFEIALDQGQDVSSPIDIGGVTFSSNCSTLSAIGLASSGSGLITCTLVNTSASVSGQTVTLTRNSVSGWSCSTSVSAALSPKACGGS